jgi:hypothetical protein
MRRDSPGMSCRGPRPGSAKLCFAEKGRQDHFFGFAFFTADFVGERKKVKEELNSMEMSARRAAALTELVIL